MSSLETLLQLENAFNNRLGLSILLIGSKQKDFPIHLIHGNITFDFILRCQDIHINLSKEGNKRTTVNFQTKYIIQETDKQVWLSFPEFIYKLYVTFIPVLEVKPDEYFSEVIIDDIFTLINSDEEISPIRSKVLRLDKIRNDEKYKATETFTERINEIGNNIKFKITDVEEEGDESYPKNLELLEILKQEFSKQHSYKVNLEKHYGTHQKNQIFELYYKGFINNNLTDENILSTNKDITLNTQDYAQLSTSGIMLDEDMIYMGNHFYEEFANETTNYSPSYSLVGEENVLLPRTIQHYPWFNDEKLLNTSRLKQLFLNNPKDIRDFDRFIDLYFNDNGHDNEQFKINLSTLRGNNENTFPLIYSKGDTFALITMLVPKTRVKVRITVFNAFASNRIIYEFESSAKTYHKRNEQWRLIYIVKEVLKWLDLVFGFYPIHPSLIHPRGMISRHYISNVLQLTMKDTDSILSELDEDSTLPIYASLFNTNQMGKDFDFSDHVKKELKRVLYGKISYAFERKLYLWIPILLEKFLYIHGLDENRKPKNKRRLYHVIDKFVVFINDINADLSADFDEEIAILTHTRPQGYCTVDGNVVPHTLGLYYMIIYNEDEMEARIFKLNCVSFKLEEKEELIKRIINYCQVIEEGSGKDLVFSDYKVSKNFMLGLKIENLKNQHFKKLLSYYFTVNSYNSLYKELFKIHQKNETTLFDEEWLDNNI